MRGPADSVPLELSRREGSDPGVVVVNVSGDLVLGACDALRSAIESEITDGARRLVVELAGVTHIDTPGFALLVQLDQWCRGEDAEFVVAALPESFREVADALRLAQSLRLTDDVEAALDPSA